VNKLDGWSVVGVILVAAVNMYFQEYDGGDDIVHCPYDKFHRCLRHTMTQQLLPQEEEEFWDNLNYATYIPPCKCRFVNKLL
jgi:hypothetical protein